MSTKTIRRNIDGMQITIELARGNREQTVQVLKELIDELEVRKNRELARHLGHVCVWARSGHLRQRAL